MSNPDVMSALRRFANSAVLIAAYNTNIDDKFIDEIINPVVDMYEQHKDIFGSNIRTVNDMANIAITPEQIEILNSSKSAGLSTVINGYIDSIINYLRKNEPKDGYTIKLQELIDKKVKENAQEIILSHEQVIQLYIYCRENILNQEDADTYKYILCMHMLNGWIPLPGEPMLYPIVYIDKDNEYEHRILVPKGTDINSLTLKFYTELSDTDKTKLRGQYESDYASIRKSYAPLNRVNNAVKWRWFGYGRSLNKLVKLYGWNRFKGSTLYDIFSQYLPLDTVERLYKMTISGKTPSLYTYENIMLPLTQTKIYYRRPVQFILPPISGYSSLKVPIIGIQDVHDPEVQTLFAQCNYLATAEEARTLLKRLVNTFATPGPIIDYNSLDQSALCQYTRWLIKAVIEYNPTYKALLMSEIQTAVNNISSARDETGKALAQENKQRYDTYGSLTPSILTPILTPVLTPVHRRRRKPCKPYQIRNEYSGHCINIGGKVFNDLIRDNEYIIAYDD